MQDLRPALSPHARLRWDARSGKTVLLAPERGLFLDDSATAVVCLCDGTRTVAEIARTLHGSYPETELALIEEDVAGLVHALLVRGLVR
jgi:pyrroloquinoline quinone biosynthesis protein D